MASNDYHFVSRWHVKGTAEQVSDVLSDSVSLPRWWPAAYLQVEEIEPGDAHHVGRIVHLHTKGWLPYTLRWYLQTIESRHPYGFTIRAWGDFVGRGVWTFVEAGDSVDLTYDWRLSVRKPFVEQWSFLLKPLFESNHRWAMAQGEQSLRLELARRFGATPDARAAVPPPPPAVGAAPFVLAGAGLAFLAVLLISRARTSRRRG
jgi:hypothetical protein